jgi:hypothetical protein
MAAPAHLIALGLKPALNQDIRAWFGEFNFLPPIPLTTAKIDTVRVFTPKESLEHLLTLLAASNHKNFILVIHGYEDGSGLSLDLSHSHKSTTKAMADHFNLQRLMDIDDPKGKLPRQERVKLGLSDAAIRQLIGLMHKVRDLKIDCIEFRACNLGRNPMSLGRFRKFLGARLVGAPDLHSFFGKGPVAIGQDLPRKHRHPGDPKWEIYNFPNALTPPNLVCCFKLDGETKPEKGHVFADSAAVLDDWIKSFLMPNGQHSKGDMPIHGLWVTSRREYLEAEQLNVPLGSWGGPSPRRVMFPLSENYAKHIIYAR